MSALPRRDGADALAAALDPAALDPAAVDPAALAPELAAAVALAGRLRETGVELAPTADPAFRAALRTRLMAVAAVQGIGEPAEAAPAPVSSAAWRRPGRAGSRVAAALAGAMATVVAAYGVAVASSLSLPGDPFYGVKRTAEAAQLRTAGDDAAQGERHLQLAATRLREVRALAAVPDAATEGRLLQGMTDMDERTRTGSWMLTEVFRDSRDAAPLEGLATFAQRQRADLLALMPALSGAARERAGTSMQVVVAVGTQAADLLMLVDCTSDCDPAPGVPAPLVAPPPMPEGSTTPPDSPAPPGGPGSPPPASTDEPSSPPPGSPPSGPAPPPSQEPERTVPVPSVPVPPVPLPSDPPSVQAPRVPLPAVPDPVPTATPLPDLPLGVVPAPPLPRLSPLDTGALPGSGADGGMARKSVR